ncbi:hypothetical protein AX15_003427 [Amanita polypyramis BW_CC]|nr:hypothetical protein AX15_003427 [Amanita polypyramis BW_CC]
MRQLSLHASALNDAEYDLYTTCLNDIADKQYDPDAVYDDAHYERMSVGVREARAWLRGRYSHIPASTIDVILKFFSPSLGQNDTVSGGQFFAALRLVIHADNGKQPDRSLAFVQAHPPSNATSNIPPPPPSRRHPDAPTKSIPLSLPSAVTQSSPASAKSSSIAGNNPFTTLAGPDAGSTHSQSHPPAPPQHPMLRVDPFKMASQSSYNPFTKTNATQKPDDPSAIKSPPLPPRKPPPVPPSPARPAGLPIVVKRSASPSRPGAGTPPLLSSSYAAGNTPPLPPPKPVSHHTSTLIKQSLHASKVAQSLKKAEEQLEKERIMQVLKSSSGPTGAATRNRSWSPGKDSVGPGAFGNVTSVTPSLSSHSGSDERGHAAPPLPKRREQLSSIRRINPSPPQSTNSYEEIALSGITLRRSSVTTAVSGMNMPSNNVSSPTERGRSYSHPPRSSERARSETNCTITSVNSHPESVAASATSSPARLSAGLPAVPPPTHPDRRERDERDRDRQYSSMSLHNGKPNKSAASVGSVGSSGSAGRLATLAQPSAGRMDTRSFDSVYGSLVSPLGTGYDQDDTYPSAVPSIYATPSEVLHPPLPPPVPTIQTSLSNALSSASPDSPTPTTAKSSTTPRVFRSKSMHHQLTPPPVPPPLRRKRPESVQIMRDPGSTPAGSGILFQELVSKFEGTSTDRDHGEIEGEGIKSLSRHLSLSRARSSAGMKSALYSGSDKVHGACASTSSEMTMNTRRSSSLHSTISAPASAGVTGLSSGHYSLYGHGRGGSVEEPLSLATLQRTFASLQPKLDKARYKAEAGISRRGFIQGDGEDMDSNGESGGEREGLVRHSQRRGSDSEGVGLGGDSLGEVGESGSRRARVATTGDSDWGSRVGVDPGGMERDELKWPVDRIAEGWKPL